MFGLFIFGAIVLAVCLLVFFCVNKEVKNYASVKKGAISLGIIVFLICTAASCVRTVPTGHTGIVTTFGTKNLPRIGLPKCSSRSNEKKRLF